MATVFLKSQTLTNIANAIRAKLGTTATMTPGEMADNINAIQTGGGGSDTSDATAVASEILADKTAYVATGKVAGTMTNQGAKTASLNAGGSYTIPAGYHNGSGKVTANSLSSQTAGTAADADILSGKTAWVGGTKLTGSMTNQGAKTASLNAGGSYTIPAGYHNGSGKVTANSLSSQTAGTATAADILSGKTAWVGGTKLTGTCNPEVVVTGSFMSSDNATTKTLSDVVGKDNILVIADENSFGNTVTMTKILASINSHMFLTAYNKTQSKHYAYMDFNGFSYDKTTGTLTTNSAYVFAGGVTYNYVAW